VIINLEQFGEPLRRRCHFILVRDYEYEGRTGELEKPAKLVSLDLKKL